MRKYTFLTVEEIKYFLNDNLCNNTDDIGVRKILANTFVREVILYDDKIIITYNFINPPTTHKITKDVIDKIEKIGNDSLISLDESSPARDEGMTQKIPLL